VLLGGRSYQDQARRARSAAHQPPHGPRRPRTPPRLTALDRSATDDSLSDGDWITLSVHDEDRSTDNSKKRSVRIRTIRRYPEGWPAASASSVQQITARSLRIWRQPKRSWIVGVAIPLPAIQDLHVCLGGRGERSAASATSVSSADNSKKRNAGSPSPRRGRWTAASQRHRHPQRG
jgi:hypothetical protein